MTRTKSAEKRTRQSRKRNIRNTIVKSQIKTGVRKLLTAVGTKNIEQAKSAFKEVLPIIDKAASKGVLHKNTASRKISRLTRKVNALSLELNKSA